MRAGKTIGDLFDVRFGLKTADDAKFVHRTKGLHKEDKPLLRGEDVKRYYYEHKGEYVWYVPKRMRAHRNTERPGEPERFEQPKVLVKDTTTDFACTYEDQHFYVKDVLIVIPRTHDENPDRPDLRFVAAVVNSSALRFYYRTTFQTLHVQAEELASLPLPKFSRSSKRAAERHDEIVGLVDQILDAKRRLAKAKSDRDRHFAEGKIASLEHQIDRLVYEAYGLTNDDIRVIEQALSAMAA